MRGSDEDALGTDDGVDDVDIEAWEASLEGLFSRVTECFRSDESATQARRYLTGLLSGVERKNGWTLAEHAGDPAPHKMQRLLNSYAWNADMMRNVIRSYILENLSEPDGVFVVDETGFVKKGTESAGVQRQYSGTAGRIENCQLGVFAAYVSGKGRALIDRRLYLPVSWTNDPARCRAAGVPKNTTFATKPALAQAMAADAWQAGARFAWFAADEAYGNSPILRNWLEAHDVGYVLAVACSHQVSTATGRHRVDALASLVPSRAWETYSAADGSKGPRLYDWAVVDTTDTAENTSRRRQVLLRRSRTGKRELAFFLTYSPRPTPLALLVTVAGRRWGVEEAFQCGKNEVGLDHYQVRLHDAWYRHITLAMLAQAWLAVTAANSGEPQKHLKKEVRIHLLQAPT